MIWHQHIYYPGGNRLVGKYRVNCREGYVQDVHHAGYISYWNQEKSDSYDMKLLAKICLGSESMVDSYLAKFNDAPPIPKRSYYGEPVPTWPTGLPRKDSTHEKMAKKDIQQKDTYQSNSKQITGPARPRKQSQNIAQGHDSFHERCKDARDYQGCINSFSGNGSSSPGGISEYERSMIELRRQELERQRNQDRIDQMRFDLEQREKQIEADRRHRQDRFRAVQGWLDDLNPPSVTCTSMPNFFGGASTTCQ